MKFDKEPSIQELAKTAGMSVKSYKEMLLQAEKGADKELSRKQDVKKTRGEVEQQRAINQLIADGQTYDRYSQGGRDIRRVKSRRTSIGKAA